MAGVIELAEASPYLQVSNMHQVSASISASIYFIMMVLRWDNGAESDGQSNGDAAGTDASAGTEQPDARPQEPSRGSHASSGILLAKTFSAGYHRVRAFPTAGHDAVLSPKGGRVHACNCRNPFCATAISSEEINMRRRCEYGWQTQHGAQCVQLGGCGLHSWGPGGVGRCRVRGTREGDVCINTDC